MKTAKSALDQREPQVFNPPAFNACDDQRERKAARSHKPIFWIQMQIIKDWWIFTSFSESLSIVFITGAFAILILGEKKGQKATQAHFCEHLGAQDFWWHNTEDGKWPTGTSLIGQVWGESWPYSEPAVESNPILPTLSSTLWAK